MSPAMKRLFVVFVLLCTLAPVSAAFAANDKTDDRIVISGPALVDRGQRVQDVVVLHGNALVRGTVKGDVVVVDGDATIRGRVEGDVVTFGGTATLGRRARVGGDVLYVDKKPVIAPGAKVSGKTTKFNGKYKNVGVGAAIAIGFWIAVTVSLLVLGLLLLLLAPRAADAVARTAKTRKGASIGVGILVSILLPLLAVLALVTVVGLPLGIGLLLALFPLYAIAYVTTAFVFGRLIVKGSRIAAFLVGLLILRLLALIPFAGGLIGLLAVIFGLGVLFVTLSRARS
jgi:carbonic anhydrase/acetyltransferase-like protein (isoleucine patch superfamily)